MPYEKLLNATHRKVFFYNLKKSELISYECDSGVKAAIHQNEHIILNIEKNKRFANTRRLAKVRLTSYFNGGQFAGRLFKMKSVLSRFRFLRNNALPGGNV